MTDAPDRERIHRAARLRAERMGLRAAPEPTPEAPDALPTTNLFALRGLLSTGRLTGAQATAARQYLADHARAAREASTADQGPDHTPGDAA